MSTPEGTVANRLIVVQERDHLEVPTNFLMLAEYVGDSLSCSVHDCYRSYCTACCSVSSCRTKLYPPAEDASPLADPAAARMNSTTAVATQLGVFCAIAQQAAVPVTRQIKGINAADATNQPSNCFNQELSAAQNV
jgi:hypothetical protein